MKITAIHHAIEKYQTILILGGTYEARMLTDHLINAIIASSKIHKRPRIIYALAGVTKTPHLPQIGKEKIYGCEIKSDRFGGSLGLSQWLRNENCDLVIDATHPFAEKITANAIQSIQDTGCPFIQYIRPIISSSSEVFVQNETEAAMEILKYKKSDQKLKPLITLGSRKLKPFIDLIDHTAGCEPIFRLINQPDPTFKHPKAKFIFAQGPKDFDQERLFWQAHRIDLLVTRQSGGLSSQIKYQVAEYLHKPIITIKRPLKSNHINGDILIFNDIDAIIAHLLN